MPTSRIQAAINQPNFAFRWYGIFQDRRQNPGFRFIIPQVCFRRNNGQQPTFELCGDERRGYGLPGSWEDPLSADQHAVVAAAADAAACQAGDSCQAAAAHSQAAPILQLYGDFRTQNSEEKELFLAIILIKHLKNNKKAIIKDQLYTHVKISIYKLKLSTPPT